MKLLLHIGTTKTGSSSIQSFCSFNRETLREIGVAYPKFPGNVNHIGVAAYSVGYEIAKDLNAQIGNRDLEQANRYKENFAEGFDLELASIAEDSVVVLSSEHLHSRCTSRIDIIRLYEFLSQRFDDIRVLCYLRPQIEHAVSLYSTLLRHGYKNTLEEFLTKRMADPEDPYFNLRNFLEPWLDVFGKNRIDVRLFDETKALKYGVISDFQSAIGIETHAESFHYPKKQAASNSMLAEEVLLSRNRAAEKKHWPSGLDSSLNKLIAEHLLGETRMPDLFLAEKFQEVFERTNPWLREHWFNGRDVLRPDWSKFQQKLEVRGYPEPFVAALVDLMYKMKPDLQASVEDTRKRIAEDIGPRLQAHMSEARARTKSEMARQEHRRKAMADAHAAERAKLDTAQNARIEAEAQMRAERFRKGMLGLWDRLTGKRAQLEKQNQLEAMWALRRDQDQRQMLIAVQLKDRQQLQLQIKAVRDRHAVALRLLHFDLANYRLMRRGEEPRARSSFALRWIPEESAQAIKDAL